MKLTALEFTVLSAIADSEYMDVEGAFMIDYPVWAPECTAEMKGALASCIKKGYVGHDSRNRETDSTCWLTKKGYEAYKNCDKSQFN